MSSQLFGVVLGTNGIKTEKTMELIEDLDKILNPFHKGVITVGNFDGVHIGHQALFHEVIEKADKIGGTSIAMTFEPHPIRVLKKNGDPPLITLIEQKIELIQSSGIDVLVVVPFNDTFAQLSARDFVEKVLVNQIGMKAMVVGEDYTFGKGREGDLERLKTLSKDMDFEVIVVNWIQTANMDIGRISSTKIRELVMEGDVTEAQKLLGRHYQIRGTVARGRDRGGKMLGYPTANVTLQDELCPKKGVYAVTVESTGKQCLGVANIGYSPTFDDHIFTVEVHILDFDSDIYDSKIRVNFVDRIRDEKKFSNIAELSDQIENDVKIARKMLAGAAA